MIEDAQNIYIEKFLLVRSLEKFDISFDSPFKTRLCFSCTIRLLEYLMQIPLFIFSENFSGSLRTVQWKSCPVGISVKLSKTYFRVLPVTGKLNKYNNGLSPVVLRLF